MSKPITIAAPYRNDRDISDWHKKLANRGLAHIIGLIFVKQSGERFRFTDKSDFHPTETFFIFSRFMNKKQVEKIKNKVGAKPQIITCKTISEIFEIIEKVHDPVFPEEGGSSQPTFNVAELIPWPRAVLGEVIAMSPDGEIVDMRTLAAIPVEHNASSAVVKFRIPVKDKSTEQLTSQGRVLLFQHVDVNDGGDYVDITANPLNIMFECLCGEIPDGNDAYYPNNHTFNSTQTAIIDFDPAKIKIKQVEHPRLWWSHVFSFMTNGQSGTVVATVAEVKETEAHEPPAETAQVPGVVPNLNTAQPPDVLYSLPYDIGIPMRHVEVSLPRFSVRYTGPTVGRRKTGHTWKLHDDAKGLRVQIEINKTRAKELGLTMLILHPGVVAWEIYNKTSLPLDQEITFIDGNPLNCAQDNLYLIKAGRVSKTREVFFRECNSHFRISGATPELAAPPDHSDREPESDGVVASGTDSPPPARTPELSVAIGQDTLDVLRMELSNKETLLGQLSISIEGENAKITAINERRDELTEEEHVIEMTITAQQMKVKRIQIATEAIRNVLET